MKEKLFLYIKLVCIFLLIFVVSNINFLVKADSNVDLSTLSYIESLKNGDVVNDNFYISGWAINKIGIKSVKIYIDGKLFGEATYGYKRNDIAIAYSNYKNSANSGYMFTVSISDLSQENI